MLVIGFFALEHVTASAKKPKHNVQQQQHEPETYHPGDDDDGYNYDEDANY